jgi:ubiquinone/menaquinone biosynthesis C-methylase UbiE
MKDLFSSDSASYAKFRPTYPSSVFEFIISCLPQKEKAWDCGTGNGQVASALAAYFEDVYATDISQSQLSEADKKINIHYSLQPSEKTNFPSASFDLITVAQAIHWFEFDKFYAEVNRTLKPGGLLAVIGYGEAIVDPDIDRILKRFQHEILQSYWDKERKWVDEKYLTIPFPFNEIESPGFQKEYLWTLDRFLGYISTWSAVKKFIQQNHIDPVAELKRSLEAYWEPGNQKNIIFPTLLRLGKQKSR